VSERLRVALVAQRYGEDVVGGAEALARRIAELLRDDVDLTVLTTCARDYLTWEDHYPPGRATVNGVEVLRFPVAAPRDPAAFARACDAAYARPDDLAAGRAWMAAQGPNAPGLLAHLDEHGRDYDAVAFMTYLYATTVDGLPRVAERALLVPTVHDEPPLRLAVFDEVFAQARLLVFSTEEERDLAQRRFGVERERGVIVGSGVDVPPAVDPGAFARRHGLHGGYALYLGRLDPSKGVADLLAHHARYRAARPDGLDLVLLGTGEIAPLDEPWVRAPGFVSEEEKHEALAGAAVVVLPSPYESLSLSQLEAWSHGRPTLANAASPVLVGQSRRSGGGLWYEGGLEYAVMLDYLVRTPVLADAIGRQGRRAVRSSYSWDRVRASWLEALARVAGAAADEAGAVERDERMRRGT
jgi:glycosyltransferase involved in cell wall biosynthesis